MKKDQIDLKILKSRYIPTSEFYSQIIDSLQDYSIFTLDKELKINSWSAGSTIIFGYEIEEVIGKNFEIIFTEEDKITGIPKEEIDLAVKEGKAVDNRWHICKDGSKFYAYGLVFPLIGLDGEMLGYVKILRDLTERRKSEEAVKKYVKELEELNNHKDSILAILSHDLRSPLSGIIGVIEYLKSDFAKMQRSELEDMIDLLHKESTNELEMLDYLLEWARIKYASEVFMPKKVGLVQYVKKVFDTLNEVAETAGINLHNEIKENTTVFADEKMLLSVIQNIVSNAIRYSFKGGNITVTAKKKEDKIIVQIRDTGIGMSKEIQEKLFTPQRNSLSKTTKEKKGSGLGLLLVKGFLETNGGEIWVESTEGKGSSFYFTLPKENPHPKKITADKIEFDENV
ncbi:MAG: PAS domain-containing sensor histidine kinase [Ignavibacteriales bacterium]|nr:MAG: PAS domain-containing sensor histidine kinase [Ignavibacteriales bacterium]